MELAAELIDRTRGWGYEPLEEFLLHARRLREFFHAPLPKSDHHVAAEDFFPDVRTWIKVRNTLGSEWLRGTHNAVDYQLADITWAKIDGSGMKWGGWIKAIPGIRAELQSFWDGFLLSVDTVTASWFLSGVRDARAKQGGSGVGPTGEAEAPE